MPFTIPKAKRNECSQKCGAQRSLLPSGGDVSAVTLLRLLRALTVREGKQG